MEMWDDENNAINHNLPKKKPHVPQQQGSMKCTYYMMLNLFQYLTTQRKGLDVILNYDKWFNPKKLEEMWSTIYKIIEYAITTKWKKELPNKNEAM